MLEFKYKIPFIEDISLNDVIKVCQTPFYMYSQQMISQKVETTKKILGENIFLSVKVWASRLTKFISVPIAQEDPFSAVSITFFIYSVDPT